MMRLTFLLLALASPLVFASTPAIAAPGDSQSRFVDCLAQNRPVQVRQLLQAQTSEVASMTYKGLRDDDRCFSRVYGDGQFSPNEVLSQDMLRGRLAEQALMARQSDVAALQPLPLQQKRYIRSWFAATGRHPAVDEMAACMADTDPAGILALIRTAQGSGDESDAIAAMSPDLTKCLGAGTKLDATRAALRSALADALYQRLSNPALSLAEVKK